MKHILRSIAIAAIATAPTLGAQAAATLPVYITINNKAEGSAPLSVRELARAVADARSHRHLVD